MASLESLSNPLERLSVLPTAMNLRKNPATGLPYWDVAIQYFINDVVISPINGGAYICSGGTQDQTAVRGGADPSADTTGVWWSTSVAGVSSSASLTPTYTAGAIGAPYTVTNGTLAAPAGSSWLVTVQCATATPTAAYTAADDVTITVTPNGVAGNVAANLTIDPLTTAASRNGWSGSGFITVGATGTSIVLGGTSAGASQVVALAGVRATFVRIA
jgi:hypothetical protein